MDQRTTSRPTSDRVVNKSADGLATDIAMTDFKSERTRMMVEGNGSLVNKGFDLVGCKRGGSSRLQIRSITCWGLISIVRVILATN